MNKYNQLLQWQKEYIDSYLSKLSGILPESDISLLKEKIISSDSEGNFAITHENLTTEESEIIGLGDPVGWPFFPQETTDALSRAMVPALLGKAPTNIEAQRVIVDLVREKITSRYVANNAFAKKSATNTANASQSCSKKKPSISQIKENYDKYIAEHATKRGWVKQASLEFGLDQKTVLGIYDPRK